MAKQKGGRPSRNTPADQRLSRNNPNAGKPKPKPKPQVKS